MTEPLDDLTWKADYATGNEDIDAQHKELLKLAQLLYAASGQGDSAEILEAAYQALFRYTEKHFREEEVYWYSVNSPMLKVQNLQHQLLTRELEQLWSDGKETHDETSGALRDWVTNRLIPHFLEQDRNAVKQRCCHRLWPGKMHRPFS